MTVYRIGSAEIQPDERRLLMDGQPVQIGARAFDVLLALLARRGHLVTKNDLLDLAWPGLVVEENNLQVQISALRKVLGPALIETVPGRGYRLGSPATDNAAQATTPSGPASAADRAGNLAAQPPWLMGRESDLQALTGMLAAHSLVTVVGAGGMGKTVLALAAASAVRERFHDGAWLVDLSSVSEPARVPQAVARTLGIGLGGTGLPPREHLVGVLREHRMLLLLDTCEHVVQEVGALAEAIGAHAPFVHILATSREVLNVPPEHVFRLDGLKVPLADEMPRPAEHGAIALFFCRARQAAPGTTMSAANAAAAAAICRQLDGMPLAIELAAARVRALGVDGVRDKLADPLRLLTRPSRTAAPRHQALHATIAWSHGLLSDAERIVFRRLGVFVGGFSLELAQHVASDHGLDEWDVLDALGNLVEKSMVVADGGDRPRYRLLDTLRAFALEQLRLSGEATRAFQRHAHAVCELFLRMDEERFGERGNLGLAAYTERLAPELDNARAALDWATGLGDDPALAVALAGASAGLFKKLGASQEALRRMLAIEPRIHAVENGDRVAWFWRGMGLLGSNGRLPIAAARDAWNRAATHYRETGAQRRLHFCLCGLGRAMNTTGAPDAAETLLPEIARLEQIEWPGWYRCHRLDVRGHTYYHQRRFDALLATSLEIRSLLALEPGEEETVLATEVDICFAMYCLHRYEEANALAESLLARTSGRAPQLTALLLMYLMDAQVLQGRIDEAAATMRRAWPLWRRADMVFFCCAGIASLLAQRGRFEAAARLEGVEAKFLRTRIPRRPGTTPLRELTQRRLAEAGLNLVDLERWRQEGEALDEPQIAAMCLGEIDESRPVSSA